MNSDQFSIELLAIRGRFLESLPERITQLQLAKDGWHWNQDTKESNSAFESLCNLTHQLVGTAGSVGFPTLSVAARDLNMKLRHLSEHRPAPLQEDLLGEIESSYAELFTVAQNCIPSH